MIVTKQEYLNSSLKQYLSEKVSGKKEDKLFVAMSGTFVFLIQKFPLIRVYSYSTR